MPELSWFYDGRREMGTFQSNFELTKTYGEARSYVIAKLEEAVDRLGDY